MSTPRIVIIGAGQSGLAAARAARDRGQHPVVLETSSEPTGSWPAYYDSLTLFSPSRFSGFPGYPFPGPPDRYPTRDEVAAFLGGYARWLGVEIRTRATVVNVGANADRFVVHLEDGTSLEADQLIAASGSFRNPYLPQLPGSELFAGELLHVADYRTPDQYAGKRVIVVGAGNSAVQVGYELAAIAETSLAVRSPIRFIPQTWAGKDLHYWLATLRLDLLPPRLLARVLSGTPVLDTGIYRDAIHRGALPQRPMFTGFTEDGVLWADGTTESADAVIFATGYRPHLPYLSNLGALDATGAPLHDSGLSTTHPGLAYLGLEYQRSFASNTLRGVHRDAALVINALATTRRR